MIINIWVIWVENFRFEYFCAFLTHDENIEKIQENMEEEKKIRKKKIKKGALIERSWFAFIIIIMIWHSFYFCFIKIASQNCLVKLISLKCRAFFYFRKFVYSRFDHTSSIVIYFLWNIFWVKAGMITYVT